MAHRAKLVAELEGLDAALKSLSLRLQVIKARRQFLASPTEDESRVVVEMDRTMTRIRAVEAKLAMIDRGEEPRFE